MKTKLLIFLLLITAISELKSQESTNEIESLKQQLLKLQKEFEEVQRQQLQQIRVLMEKIENLEKSRGAPGAVVAPKTKDESVVDWKKEVISQQKMEVEKQKWTPTSPIRLIGSGNNYVDFSLDALMSAGSSTARDVSELQPAGHDPKQRGFTLQQLEFVLNGAVDPYFTGQANLVYHLDSSGESGVEIEEAYADTLALPWNLQLRAGQFYTDFGRLNPTHPHQWNFVDMPLVNARLLGEDGLRNLGARISYLMPLPFYSELFFTIQNSGGTASSFLGAGEHSHNGEETEIPPFGRQRTKTSLHSVGDLLFTPRYLASFNLTDEHTLSVGASAAFGPNSTGSRGHTEIYGADLYWKWKPRSHHGGFPFLSFQSEFMLRRYTADKFNWDLNQNGILDKDSGEMDFDSDTLPDYFPKETITDYGFYSEFNYGFKKGWVASLRGEYLTGDKGYYEQIIGRDEHRITRKRLSSALTWYITEFSKLRLQYNFDHRELFGSDHSVWLQFEFLLGEHAAHKF